MRFRQSSLTEITNRITGLGLRACLVCGSTDLVRSDYPAVLYIGDFARHKDDPDRDPEGNVRFLLTITCAICGHTLLFETERLVGPGEKIMTNQSREDEARNP